MKIIIKNSTLQFQSKEETALDLTTVQLVQVFLEKTPVEFKSSTSSARKIYYVEAVAGAKYHVTFETDGRDTTENFRYGAGFSSDIPAAGGTASNTTQATNSEGTRTLDVVITAPSNGYIWMSIFDVQLVVSKSIARKNF